MANINDLMLKKILLNTPSGNPIFDKDDKDKENLKSSIAKLDEMKSEIEKKVEKESNSSE